MKKKIFYLPLLFMSLSVPHASISKEKSIPKRNSFLHKKRVAKTKQRAIKKNNKTIVIDFLIALSFILLILLIPVAIYYYKKSCILKNCTDRIEEETTKYNELYAWLLGEYIKMKALERGLDSLSMELALLSDQDSNLENEDRLKGKIKNVITDIGWVIDDREAEITSNRESFICLKNILVKEGIKEKSMKHIYVRDCNQKISNYQSILRCIACRKTIEIYKKKIKKDLDELEINGKIVKEEIEKFNSLEGGIQNLMKEIKNLTSLYNKTWKK